MKQMGEFLDAQNEFQLYVQHDFSNDLANVALAVTDVEAFLKKFVDLSDRDRLELSRAIVSVDTNYNVLPRKMQQFAGFKKSLFDLMCTLRSKRRLSQKTTAGWDAFLRGLNSARQIEADRTTFQWQLCGQAQQAAPPALVPEQEQEEEEIFIEVEDAEQLAEEEIEEEEEEQAEPRQREIPRNIQKRAKQVKSFWDFLPVLARQAQSTIMSATDKKVKSKDVADRLLDAANKACKLAATSATKATAAASKAQELAIKSQSQAIAKSSKKALDFSETASSNANLCTVSTDPAKKIQYAQFALNAVQVAANETIKGVSSENPTFAQDIESAKQAANNALESANSLAQVIFSANKLLVVAAVSQQEDKQVEAQQIDKTARIVTALLVLSIIALSASFFIPVWVNAVEIFTVVRAFLTTSSFARSAVLTLFGWLILTIQYLEAYSLTRLSNLFKSKEIQQKEQKIFETFQDLLTNIGNASRQTKENTIVAIRYKFLSKYHKKTASEALTAVRKSLTAADDAAESLQVVEKNVDLLKNPQAFFKTQLDAADTEKKREQVLQQQRLAESALQTLQYKSLLPIAEKALRQAQQSAATAKEQANEALLYARKKWSKEFKDIEAEPEVLRKDYERLFKELTESDQINLPKSWFSIDLTNIVVNSLKSLFTTSSVKEEAELFAQQMDAELFVDFQEDVAREQKEKMKEEKLLKDKLSSTLQAANKAMAAASSSNVWATNNAALVFEKSAEVGNVNPTVLQEFQQSFEPDTGFVPKYVVERMKELVPDATSITIGTIPESVANEFRASLKTQSS